MGTGQLLGHSDENAGGPWRVLSTSIPSRGSSTPSRFMLQKLPELCIWFTFCCSCSSSCLLEAAESLTLASMFSKRYSVSLHGKTQYHVVSSLPTEGQFTSCNMFMGCPYKAFHLQISSRSTSLGFVYTWGSRACAIFCGVIILSILAKFGQTWFYMYTRLPFYEIWCLKQEKLT